MTMSGPSFPSGSDGKESSWNMGDQVLIPRLGRSLPIQYSCLENFMDRGTWQTTFCKKSDTTERLTLSLWAFLVAQLVKNLSAMQEALVQLLDWEEPLEKG